MRTLVLNNDYTFLGICDWKSAICAAYSEKAIVEESYEQEIHSVSLTMRVPAVIRLKKLVRIAYERITYVSYTKHNVHLRDNWTCQYCGKKYDKRKLGVDHVIPESRGGPTSWENCVTCCHTCNLIKDNKTPTEAHMHLIRIPKKPHGFTEIIRIKIGEIHKLWHRYLGIIDDE